VDLGDLAGFLLLSAGLTLMLASYRARRTDGAVPWLSMLIGCLCISSLVALATFSVADAFVSRGNDSGGCAQVNPTVPPPRTDVLPNTFAFPEESAGMTGLHTSLGRGRPDEELSSQVLILTSEPRRRVNGRLPRPAPARLREGRFLEVSLSDIRRDDGTRVPEASVSAWAKVVNDSNLELVLCVAPLANEEEVDPGTYTGVLSVIDWRVTRIDVPVTVELQFNRWPVLLTLLIGTLAIAAFTLFNGTKQLTGDVAGLHPQTMRDFGVWMISNPVAIGTGVVAAAAIFANQYLADPAWSGRTAEVFALIGAVAAAFLGAATVAAGVGPDRARRSREAAAELQAERLGDQPAVMEEKPPPKGKPGTRTRKRWERWRQRQAEKRRVQARQARLAQKQAQAAAVAAAVDADEDALEHPDDMGDAGTVSPEEEAEAAVIPVDEAVTGEIAPELVEAEELEAGAVVVVGPPTADEVIPPDEPVGPATPRPQAPPDDDDTLEHPEDMGDAGAVSPEEEAEAAVIPDDEEVAGAVAPDLAEVEETGEEPLSPDEVIPPDEPVEEGTITTEGPPPGPEAEIPPDEPPEPGALAEHEDAGEDAEIPPDEPTTGPPAGTGG
jgi:hypothetical protein